MALAQVQQNLVGRVLFLCKTCIPGPAITSGDHSALTYPNSLQGSLCTSNSSLRSCKHELGCIFFNIPVGELLTIPIHLSARLMAIGHCWARQWAQRLLLLLQHLTQYNHLVNPGVANTALDRVCNWNSGPVTQEIQISNLLVKLWRVYGEPVFIPLYRATAPMLYANRRNSMKAIANTSLRPVKMITQWQ